MSFTDLAKSHATFIANGPFSETIGYLARDTDAWTTVHATVTRELVSPIGEAIKGVIRVFVSKAEVPDVFRQGSTIRLEPQFAGDPQILYRVTEVKATEGGWILEATK